MNNKIESVFCLFSFFLLMILSSCKNDDKIATQLETPTNFYTEGKVVYWNEVLNADGYIIEFENKDYDVSEAKFDYTFIETPNDYSIKIHAYSNKNEFIDSEEVEYTFTVEDKVNDGYDIKGFYYKLLDDESGYEVAKGNANIAGSLLIPSYFHGLPVKKISKRGFTLASEQVEADPIAETCMNYTTKSVTLPKYLEEIGSKAFNGLGSITQIEFPSTLKVIGAATFASCIGLEEVIFNEGLIEINNGAFKGANIKELNLPSTLETIGKEAFATFTNELYDKDKYFSNQFVSVTLPDSLKKIDNNAFQGAVNLVEVNIGDNNNLEYVGVGIFNNTKWYDNQTGDIIGFGNIALNYVGTEENVIIPNKYKKIASQFIVMQKSVKSVKFHDGIEFVGVHCLMGYSIKEIVLPSDLKKIPDSAFTGCGIENLIIPDSVESIGESAFSICNKLTSIVIPKSVKEIGNLAFKECSNLLEVVNLSSIDITMGSKENGYVGYYAKTVTNDLNYKSNIVIQDDYVFYNDNNKYYLVTHLGDDTNLVLPENINGNTYEIKEKAFQFNLFIKTVTFSNGVSKVGYRSFWQCGYIEKVVLSDSITEIAKQAFGACSSLETIYLKKSLKIVGENAFDVGKNVIFYYDGTKDEFESIEGIDTAIVTSDNYYILRLTDGDYKISC